jgi:allantoinase
VAVAAGRVRSVGPLDRAVTGREVVELGDDVVLLPGLVDTHVHVNEPGRTEWEGFATATRAAAAGGVTTVLDMPLNSIPPTLDPDALETKRAAARGQLAVDVGFWGGAVPGNAGRLGALLRAGAFGVKCFLPDSGVGEFPAIGTAGLPAVCAELAGVDGLLLVHAEDPARLEAAPAPAGRTYDTFLRSRPPDAEDDAIAAVIDAASATGVRLHVVHLSSAGALPLLAKAKADGVRITVETCPHYLVLRAEEVPDGATQFKCCPPVRDDANRDALWAGLADGTIDLVVSDHSPSTADRKALGTGDFGEAWGGISSLQLGLPLVWTEARRRGHDLADVVRWMGTGPAALAGLTTKGAIRQGAAADLVAFAPDDELVVHATRLHHRNPLTPYEGRRLTGVARTTWLAGSPVTADGPVRGRLLSRGEA